MLFRSMGQIYLFFLIWQIKCCYAAKILLILLINVYDCVCLTILLTFIPSNDTFHLNSWYLDNYMRMKIEDSKYILYFFYFSFFGLVASNQDFVSICKISDSFSFEKEQSHISDESQSHNKDFYRRTYQNNPPIKNTKYINVTPTLYTRSRIDYVDKSYYSYFEDISISLTIKDLIFPFNYFL